MKKIFYILCILGCLILNINSSQANDGRTKRNCVRVFMHSPGDYSVMVQEGDELVVVHLKDGSPYGVKPKIFKDVSKNKKMYYKVDIIPPSFWGASYTTYSNIEIHVHSEKDINGAGWNRGKFGRGQTEVIE